MQTILEYQNCQSAEISLNVNSITFGSLKLVATKLIHDSDNTHLQLNAYPISETELSILQLSSLILTTILWGRYIYLASCLHMGNLKCRDAQVLSESQFEWVF